jgi:hypothetical protein
MVGIHDRRIARAVGFHIDGVKRLGQGADLVDLTRMIARPRRIRQTAGLSRTGRRRRLDAVACGFPSGSSSRREIVFRTADRDDQAFAQVAR